MPESARTRAFHAYRNEVMRILVTEEWWFYLYALLLITKESRSTGQNGDLVIATQSESGRTPRPRRASLVVAAGKSHSRKQRKFSVKTVKNTVESDHCKTCVPPKCPFNLTEDESSRTESIGFTWHQLASIGFKNRACVTMGANRKFFKFTNYRPLCYVSYCKDSCEMK